MTDYEGLVALVTGGASGIGAATARLLTSRGARVAVLDVTGRAGGSGRRGASRRLRRRRPRLRLRRRRARRHRARWARRRGQQRRDRRVGRRQRNDDDEWHRVLDVNVVGVARVTRAALPHLRAVRARGRGEHVVHRGRRRGPEPGAVRREQGCGARPDPRDGRRPRPRRHPGQRGAPRDDRHPVGRAGCSPRLPTPRRRSPS